ncbi:uncharacterized protein K444DRAFT_694455 [Hyaloscypha bicolor E]|uniref:Uncharacterized protein n=1 Tax=Hyaloscypha bicolor E TaxID=1095630 RepID=A0A2J6SZ82_9HELO|nr:uncharacterized protein K444DRAFT_694455 [Hyaloscypha bicolor E]PMD56087.1 hypothetical protein K444DRAFT_694455 [Hyaloscypha bicolor E]
MLPAATRDSETDHTSPLCSNNTKTAIITLLRTYQTALNASSTSSILELYTSDGVCMAQHFSQPWSGAIIAAYDKDGQR